MSAQPTRTDRFFAATFLKLLPRWVTPNHITIARFISIPFVLLLLVHENYAWGMALFVLSAFTDALDGALARMTERVTDWGKMFDPLADKLLIGAVVALLVTKYISVVLATVIITIELFLILNGYYKKKYQNLVTQAEKTGKAKMVLQSLGVAVLLLYTITPIPMLIPLATATLYIAVVFALWSLLVYRAI